MFARGMGADMTVRGIRKASWVAGAMPAGSQPSLCNSPVVMIPSFRQNRLVQAALKTVGRVLPRLRGL